MWVKGIGEQCVTVDLSDEELLMVARGLDHDAEFSVLATAFRSLAALAGLRGDLPVDGDVGVVDVMASAGLPVVGG